MSQHVELSTFNLRYEGYRLRDEVREARLLVSIAAHGIEQPLEGVDASGGRFLLNGFKRYRCAQKLGIHCVPYLSLGSDEATAIASLMRGSRDQALGILEQARFVVELLTLHGLSVAEVADMLSRSKAWVSMRRGLLAEMGDTIQRILFQGTFPVYCYMYTLGRFRRMNSVAREQLERFVQRVAGRRLSVREIDLLAHGYFRGLAVRCGTSVASSMSAAIRSARSLGGRGRCPRRCARTRSGSIRICCGGCTKSATVGRSGSTKSWWRKNGSRSAIRR